MSYRISKEFKETVGAFFKVPTEVVDNYINPMTDPQFVMVLLWVFCRSRRNIDTEKLKQAFANARPRVDVLDALDFWVKEGILEKDGTAEVRSAAKEEQSVVPLRPEFTEPAKPKLEPLPIARPTNEQIMLRAKESDDVKALFNSVQEMLGRTIGFDMQCMLLMLHDTYGLPIEVILMLVEYCVSIDKSSTAYIEKMGRNWAEKEIDSIEKADERISVLRECNSLWTKLARMAGLPNPKPTESQSKHLRKWKNEYGFDIEMIYLAYEEMADHCNKLSFSYMDKVLQNWYISGVKTAEDAENAKIARAAQKSKPAEASKPDNTTQEKNNEPSYDLEEYKRKSRQRPLVYEKRKKS